VARRTRPVEEDKVSVLEEDILAEEDTAQVEAQVVPRSLAEAAPVAIAVAAAVRSLAEEEALGRSSSDSLVVDCIPVVRMVAEVLGCSLVVRKGVAEVRLVDTASLI